MDSTTLCAMMALISCVALLYSSIGHGGASGYILVMLLFGFAPAEIRPTVLIANIMVSSIAATQFYRAGYFPWSIFWKFAIASVPFAYVGGSLTLTSESYKMIAGIVLCFSALRLMISRTERLSRAVRAPSTPAFLMSGAAIGFISGLIGIGGGVFLSPLVILAGWAGLRETSAIAALFVLINSVSGLLGQMNSFQGLPPVCLIIVGAAIAAGFLGSMLGSKRLPLAALRSALSFVLLIAAWKLIFL